MLGLTPTKSTLAPISGRWRTPTSPPSAVDVLGTHPPPRIGFARAPARHARGPSRSGARLRRVLGAARLHGDRAAADRCAAASHGSSATGRTSISCRSTSPAIAEGGPHGGRRRRRRDHRADPPERGFEPRPGSNAWDAPRWFVHDPAGHRVEVMSAPPPSVRVARVRVKPPALRRGDDRGRRAVEPAADALGHRAGDRVLLGPRLQPRVRAQPPQGPRLPRRHRRGARRRRPVGAERARDRHGPRARRRLRRRPPVQAHRLGHARRPADLLRLQRHHGAAPRDRPARRLGHVLQPDVPALHAQEGRADARSPRTRSTARFRPSRSAASPRIPTTRTCSRSARASVEAPIAGGCLTLVAAEPRHAVRDRDRRLHRRARGPQRGPVHDRRAPQPPDRRRQVRQRRRVRVRHRRQPQGSGRSPSTTSRRCRSRRSSTS